MLDLLPLLAFPVDAVPDGDVWAPHHYWSVAVGLLACAVVWDDYRDQEPVWAVVGLGVGLAGFALVWPFYPVTGALLAAAGPVGAVVAAARRWPDCYPRRWLALLILAVLVALDDWTEHTFGVWTPLDWVWGAYIHHLIP